mmetsp:Transcript_73007/g.200424  ORF Transcript_73007/g.200424 Transcript_73007/m.200424 type:complete len:98 (-) Transcript_73007:1948-2241(-)
MGIRHSASAAFTTLRWFMACVVVLFVVAAVRCRQLDVCCVFKVWLVEGSFWRWLIQSAPGAVTNMDFKRELRSALGVDRRCQLRFKLTIASDVGQQT